MSERFNNISIQMTPDVESPFDPNLINKSVFFKSALSLKYDTLVCPADEKLIKDKSLGVLWEEIEPENGAYTLEIATVIPYYLPMFDNRPECSFTIDDSELVVSSRMMRCFYSEAGADTDPMQYFLCHLLALDSLREQQKFTSFHPMPLRSFVSKRFPCRSGNAEEMIQDHFLEWREQFVREISSMIDALRTAAPQDTKHLLPQLTDSSLPVFWLHIQGANGKRGTQQFVGDMSSAAFRSLRNIDAETIQAVRNYLDNGNSITVHESALALSHTFCHHGYLGLALVQVCIACESVLAESYRLFLKSRGVSNSKYNDQKRDITYSQLLNLHLATMRDVNQLNDRNQLITKLNWARSCRNDMMHEGKLKQSVSAGEVDEAIKAAEALISFVLAELTSEPSS